MIYLHKNSMKYSINDKAQPAQICSPNTEYNDSEYFKKNPFRSNLQMTLIKATIKN